MTQSIRSMTSLELDHTDSKRDRAPAKYQYHTDSCTTTKCTPQSLQLLPPDPVPERTCWSKGFWTSSLSTAASTIKGFGVKDDTEDVTIKIQRPSRFGKPVTLVKYRESLPYVTEQPSFCVSNEPSNGGSEEATPPIRQHSATSREVSRQTICKPIFTPEDTKVEYTAKGRLLTARCRSLSDAGLIELNNSLTDALTGRSLITDTDTPTSANGLKLFAGGSHSDILYHPPTPPLTLYESILQDPIARPVSLHHHEIKHTSSLTKPHTSRGHRKYTTCQSAHKRCVINKSLNRKIPSSKWIFVDNNGSFTLDKKLKVSPTLDASYNIEY